MKKCKKCNLLFEDNGNYCLQCGKRLVSVKENIEEKEVNEDKVDEIKETEKNNEVEMEKEDNLPKEEVTTEDNYEQIKEEVNEEIEELRKEKAPNKKVSFFKRKIFLIPLLLIIITGVGFAGINYYYLDNIDKEEKELIVEVEKALSVDYKYISSSNEAELKSLKSQLYEQVLLKNGTRDKKVLNDLLGHSSELSKNIKELDNSYIFEKDMIENIEKNLNLDNYFFQDEKLYKNLKNQLEKQKKLEVGTIDQDELTELNNKSIELHKELSEENIKLVEEYTNYIQETMPSVNLNEESLALVEEYDKKYKNFLNRNDYKLAIPVLVEYTELLGLVSEVGDNYEIALNQISYNDYPNVKLYLEILDKETEEIPEVLQEEFFYLKEIDEDGKSVEKEILSADQVKVLEKTNISLVMDISKSMQNETFEVAKTTVENFINDANRGNVALIAFSEFVYELKGFNSEDMAGYEEVFDENDIELSSLYNALYWGVEATIFQNGPKAVIVYTDGEDNTSTVTYKEVIEFANTHNVPIYIIGIGNRYDENILRKISQDTGGQFFSNKKMSDIEEIYNSIDETLKELFVIHYKTEANLGEEVNVEVGYLDRDMEEKTVIGGMTEVSYTPNLLR